MKGHSLFRGWWNCSIQHHGFLCCLCWFDYVPVVEVTGHSTRQVNTVCMHVPCTRTCIGQNAVSGREQYHVESWNTGTVCQLIWDRLQILLLLSAYCLWKLRSFLSIIQLDTTVVTVWQYALYVNNIFHQVIIIILL